MVSMSAIQFSRGVIVKKESATSLLGLGARSTGDLYTTPALRCGGIGSLTLTNI